jgi:hypothetical protein
MSKIETVSTEIVVRILEIKPAVVNFNYQEISDHLDSVLTKYRGLVFTESTVADCKKTIAELRKGQKSLDEFRKTTKKQLTESVTFFENQCKSLYGKFEDVIQPLTKQHDQFELDRREKKRAEVKSIINTLILDHNLTEKYAVQLIILEDYLNKGKPIKTIKTELTALANTLKTQQEKEAQDIDLIKTKVELANAQYQLSNVLMPDQYVRLLSYQSVAEIELLIISDAQQIEEREKKAAEALVAKATEAPKIEVMHPESTETPKQILTRISTPVMVAKQITSLYEITGTEEQLLALEAYLDANNFSWIDRSE